MTITETIGEVGATAAPLVNNVYSETGNGACFSTNLMAVADPGSHSTQANSLLTLQSTPVGSGVNGPAVADYGLTVSALKHQFPTSTAVGEVDAINAVVRQGGTASDGACLLGNIAHYGTGYICFGEGNSQNVVSGAVQHNIHTAFGVIDNVDQEYLGYYAVGTVGPLNEAFMADTSGTSTWNYLFRGRRLGADVFSVDGNGNMAANSLSLPAWTPYTPSVYASSGVFTNAGATGKYMAIGKTVLWTATITMTTVGTASGVLKTNLPIGVKSDVMFPGRENTVTGKLLQGIVVAAYPTVMNVFDYANGSIIGDGRVCILSGTYESI